MRRELRAQRMPDFRRTERADIVLFSSRLEPPRAA
jgi:hypothetical protein